MHRPRPLSVFRDVRHARSGPRSLAPRLFRTNLEPLEQRYLLSSIPLAPMLFYDNSRWDSNTPGFNAADDSAIAPDKTAYLPGGAATTFANVSSYTRGINGLMIDLVGSHGTITANDFTFKVGNNNAPGSWAPLGVTPVLTVRGGAGLAGADRIELVWPDGTIRQQWLQVIVAANANTGLASSYMFFFGSAVADSGAGDLTAYTVSATDESSARNDPHGPGNLATISNVNDYTRDGLVNGTDQIASRNNATNPVTSLKFANMAIAAPTLAAALTLDSGPDGAPNSDGVTNFVQISGNLSDAYPVTSLKAGINGGPVTTDCLALLQPDGSFTLSTALLTSMNGGTLPDGPYTVELQSLDAQGQSTHKSVSFVKKTTIGTPAAPDLVAASDLGTSSTDNLTADNTPTFAVTADTGTLVRVYVDNVPMVEGTTVPGLLLTTPALADGVHQVKVIAQDGAGNAAMSTQLAITVSTALPAVTVSTMMLFTDDLTPHVTATGTSPLGLANGTVVNLDVDLNNDGDFADAGELGRTQGTLYNGTAYFQLTPALPASVGSPYLVQLRTRIADAAGSEGASPLQSLRVDTLGSNILANYVNTPDPAYGYDTPTTITGAGYTAKVYDLTSQTWLTPADTTRSTWHHWLTVIVPTGNLAQLGTTALLRINGGNNNDARPTGVDSNLALLATTLNVVVVDLRMVPNQAMVFASDPTSESRTEDEIIAYTFDQFTDHLGNPAYSNWPLLLPMVKSAVAAMNAVQSVDQGITGGHDVNDFIVTGASKRGWTTWLTPAVDSRVKAIVPLVFDALNLDEQMMHHHAFYADSPAGPTFVDGFSVAIQDYVGFNIPESVQTQGGQELGRVVDPYRYLSNPNYNIPKLSINGSQDEFFVPDSSQYYFSDLPGTQNYLRYIPGKGHGLDATQVTNSTMSFMNAVIKNLALPVYSWTIQPDGSIRMQATGTPTQVVMWQATNPNYRDFRASWTSLTFTSTPLVDQGGGVWVANVPTPATGATQFFIEITYGSPLAGRPYIFTSDVQVKSANPLGTWPNSYYSDPGGLGGGGGGSLVAADLNPLAAALAVAAGGESLTTADLGPLVPVTAPAPVIAAAADSLLALDESFDFVQLESPDGDEDESALLDLALAELG